MTALLARLERDYARAIRFEERAPTVQAAWSRAAASESALRKLRLVQAGLPLPAPREPRTQRNLVRGAFAALASLGRVIARSAQAAAALAKAQVVNAARRAARAVHRSLRSALESIVNIIIGALRRLGRVAITTTGRTKMRKTKKAMRRALRVASAVADSPGVTSQQLRLNLGDEPAELADALAAAERRGLVRREFHVYLTPAGEALVRGERKGPRSASSDAVVAQARRTGGR